MLGRVRRETTKLQPRLRQGRQPLLQPFWGYDATSATFSLEVTQDERQSGGDRASVPDQPRDRQQTDTAPSDHAPDSAHKSSPNRDRAVGRSSAVSARAFPTPAGSRKEDWNPGKVDVRQAS